MTDLFSSISEIPIHTHERGQQNQFILNKNHKRFSRQCRILFDALWNGERLTSFDCAMKYKILDARRRMGDLKSAGVKISERLLENHFKEKFFTEEDKIHNQKFLIL